MQTHSEKSSSSVSFFRLFFLGWLMNAILGEAQPFPPVPQLSRYSQKDKKYWVDNLSTNHEQAIFKSAWSSLITLESPPKDIRPDIQQKISDTGTVNIKEMLISNSTHMFSSMITDSSLNQNIAIEDPIAIRSFLNTHKNLITGQVIISSTVQEPINSFFTRLLKKEWNSLRINQHIGLSFALISELPFTHRHFICQELDFLKYDLDTNAVCRPLLFNKEDFLWYFAAKALILVFLTFTLDYTKNSSSLNSKKSIEEILKKYLTKASLSSDTFAQIEENLKTLDASFLKKSNIGKINKGFEEIFKYHTLYNDRPWKHTWLQVQCTFFMEMLLFGYIHHRNFSIFDYGCASTTMQTLPFIYRFMTEMSSFEMLSKADIQSLQESKENLNKLAQKTKKQEVKASEVLKAINKTKTQDNGNQNYPPKPPLFNLDNFTQEKNQFDIYYADYQVKIQALKNVYYPARSKDIKNSAARALIAKETNFAKVCAIKDPSEKNLKKLKDTNSNIQTDIASMTKNIKKIKRLIAKQTSSADKTLKKVLKEKPSETTPPVRRKKQPKKKSAPREEESLPEKESSPGITKKPAPSITETTTASSKISDNRLNNVYVQDSISIFGELLQNHDEKQVPPKAVADVEILLKTFLICITCNYFYDINKLRNNTLYYLENIMKDSNFNELWNAAEQCYYFLIGSISTIPDTSLIKKIRNSHFTLDQDPKLKIFDSASNITKVGNIMDKIETIKKSECLTTSQQSYLANCLLQLQTTFLIQAHVPVPYHQAKEAIYFRHPCARK